MRKTPSIAGRIARRVLQGFGLHPEDRPRVHLAAAGCKALCIATNHAALDLGVPTGVFASELSVPYYAFLDAGMHVELASPLGGLVPVEPLSLRQAIRTGSDDRMLVDAELRSQLMHSLSIAQLDFTTYDVIYFAGGWGAAFDLGHSELLGTKVSAAFAAGNVLGGICHGPLGLLRARKPDGELWIKGRRLTAVTDRQVRQLGVACTPLHPESELRAARACFAAKAHPFRGFS